MPPRSRADAAVVKKPDYRELGVSGTNILAGLISEETVPALQGQMAFTTYRGMRFDATGAAILKSIELPIRSARWFVSPASDSPDDIQMADFVHECMWNFGAQSLDDIIRLASLSVVYGFSLCEILYKQIDSGDFAGKVGWDALSLRQANTKWRWNEAVINGRRQLVSMTQLAPPRYETVDIPRNKFILWVNDLEGTDYDGYSIFRSAYKDYFIRDRLYRIRAIGLERSYMSVPVASLPDGYSDEEMQLAKRIVTSIRSDEQAGVTKPESLGLELVRWDINSAAMDSAISYHNRQMLLSCLAQSLDLGSSGRSSGSYALSANQSDQFTNAITALANYFAQQLNLEPGIPSLVGLNYSDVTRQHMPQLEHGDLGQRAIQSLAASLGPLAQAGFLTPDGPTEDKLRRMFDLPAREGSITAEALVDLIPESLPTGPEWGFTSAKGPPPPGPQGGPISPNTGGGTGSNQPQTSPRTPGPGLAPQENANRPVMPGRSPAPQVPPGLNAAERLEWERAYVRLQDVLVRKGWEHPRGRPTDEERAAVRATERFTEALDGVFSAIQPGSKPPKPSVVAARNRRPYNVQFSFADAAEHAVAPQRAVARRHAPVLADSMRRKVRVLPRRR